MIYRDPPSIGDDFDMDIKSDIDSTFKYVKLWFGFVLLLTLTMMAGSVYVVYLLLAHFGVIA